MIEVRNLKKSFGNHKVLDGVNLKVPAGKTMVVIGQSGCGKSVLLKQLIGIIKPEEGEILINGTDISKLSEDILNQIRLEFGMVFQESALFDSLTVFENIAFSLIEHTEKSEEEIGLQVHKCLSTVGLSGIENKMPSELSGGMKKRVALARAISMNPKFILYDEPTVGIDPVMADSINKLIKDLHTRLEVTSVIVTHDMDSAYYVGDRIAMLYKGKIIEEGTVEEIKNTENPMVRKFINGISEGFEQET